MFLVYTFGDIILGEQAIEIWVYILSMNDLVNM